MIAGDLFDYLVSWVICRLYLSLLSKNDWRSKSRENFEAVPSRLVVSRYCHSAFLKAQPDYNLARPMWWLLSTSSCVQERLQGISKISAVCVRSKFLGFMHRLTYDAQKSVSSERPKYVFRVFICQFWPTAHCCSFRKDAQWNALWQAAGIDNSNIQDPWSGIDLYWWDSTHRYVGASLRFSEEVLNLFPRFPTRKEVTHANARRLGELPGRPQIYHAQDQAGVDHREAPISHELMVNILDKLVAPSRLELKVGAQVMLIKVLWMIRASGGMKLISLRI